MVGPVPTPAVLSADSATTVVGVDDKGEVGVVLFGSNDRVVVEGDGVRVAVVTWVI